MLEKLRNFQFQFFGTCTSSKKKSAQNKTPPDIFTMLYVIVLEMPVMVVAPITMPATAQATATGMVSLAPDSRVQIKSLGRIPWLGRSQVTTKTVTMLHQAAKSGEYPFNSK